MAANRYVIVSQASVTVPGAPSGPPSGVPDPVVSVGALDFSATPYTLPITIPPYDVAIPNALTELHAIQFPAGTPLPTDAVAALALSLPRGSADVTGIQGQTVSLAIPGMTASAPGTQDTLVVIAGYAS